MSSVAGGSFSASFDRKKQLWSCSEKENTNTSLVLYAQVDDSFSVWDPARNATSEADDRPEAFVFGPTQVWDGLPGERGQPLCNGLIQDLAGWQKERGSTRRPRDLFSLFNQVIGALSPSEDEHLELGELARVSLDDARDVPTLRMAYGDEVPMVYASAAMRRILALAYLLVWAHEEHREASRLTGEQATRSIVFLLDEIEAHLHPRWQRKILKSLLELLGAYLSASVQLVVTTHSPLVLASVEPFFGENDAWFDLGLEAKIASLERKVVLEKRPFEPHGDVSSWLTSDAFDLPSARSLESEKLLQKAAEIIDNPQVENGSAQEVYRELVSALSPTDPFLFRWRGICEKKGLL